MIYNYITIDMFCEYHKDNIKNIFFKNVVKLLKDNRKIFEKRTIILK